MREEIIVDELDITMGKIHQQYMDALREKRDDEANGYAGAYAGAYAIVKELFMKLSENENRTPIGVSSWKEYGKKYGYWEYFKKNHE